MDPTFIPHKTTSGAEEIRTRAMRLESRLRALLIQIDGNKRLADLQASIGLETLTEDLRRLRELGLIGWDDSLSTQRKSATQ